MLKMALQRGVKDPGIYYYTTYNDATIHAIDMHRCNLDGNEIVSYPFMDEAKIEYQN